MKQTTIHCDNCGKRVDYTDCDDTNHNNGFTLQNDSNYPIRYRNHHKTSSGSYHHPIQALVLPDNICSKACMQEYLDVWISSLPERSNTHEQDQSTSS